MQFLKDKELEDVYTENSKNSVKNSTDHGRLSQISLLSIKKLLRNRTNR